MTNLEHAIENAIFSFYHFKYCDNPLELWEEWDKDINLTGMSKEEIEIIKECARYVRYALCFTEDKYLQLIGKDK